MKRCLTFLSFAILLSLPLRADVTVFGPGAVAVPEDNCGFTVFLGSGPLGLNLLNDAPGGRTDLQGIEGEYYQLRVKEVTFFPDGVKGITIHTSSVCGYTRSYGADECEIDPNRPEIANPEEVPPGPDLPANAGVYAWEKGEIDFLGCNQPDFTYWNTFQARTGQLFPYCIRRCRLVEDSANSYLFLFAP